ncbi:hypothetical protein [Kitasatospora sp. NPDC093558]|uniref:hypothetical protein n=1 Tax=Kitasatospora sp. NPDC093558 TaxID=3155201 RepID=UPI003448F36B
MKSLSVRVALVVSTLAAALAVMVGHTDAGRTMSRVTADNGWSAPAPAAATSAPALAATATGALDNGWS